MIVIKRQKYEIRRGMEVDVLEAMFAYERSLIGSTILDLISWTDLLYAENCMLWIYTLKLRITWK